MTQGGFFEPTKISPTGLTIVIAMHAAALTALALSKTEIVKERFVPIEIFNVDPPKPDPVVEPPKPREAQIERPATPSVEPPIVNWRQAEEVTFLPPPPVGPIGSIGDGPTTIVEPPADPVRTEASLDPRFAHLLQPAYPAAEQRMEREGVVKVRVLIGADGKVKAAEPLSTASTAFWEATQRHALRHWRFKPATLDGKPIESWKVMTVRFEMKA